MDNRNLAELMAEKAILDRKIARAKMELINELLIETRKQKVAGALTPAQQQLLSKAEKEVTLPLPDRDFLLDLFEYISGKEI